MTDKAKHAASVAHLEGLTEACIVQYRDKLDSFNLQPAELERLEWLLREAWKGGYLVGVEAGEKIFNGLEPTLKFLLDAKSK